MEVLYKIEIPYGLFKDTCNDNEGFNVFYKLCSS